MTSTFRREPRDLLILVGMVTTCACGPIRSPLRHLSFLGSEAVERLPAVVLLEPVGSPRQPVPLVRPIGDPARLRRLLGYLDNEPARLARRLHRLAWRIVDRRGPEHPFFIVVVKGGNHAAAGLRIRRGAGIEVLPEMPYVKLGPRRDRFRTTLLHETGHVLLGILAGRRGVPTEAIAPLPHSTAMISDRGTAFNEGFAIHLETVLAHFTQDPDLMAAYHRRLRRGRVPLYDQLLLHPVRDIATYSQDFARYVAIRDNAYSFRSAHTGPDYYRVQLDPARDFRELRSADQLLASEGFVASFFFHLVAGRLRRPRTHGVAAAYRPILVALRKMLRQGSPDPRRPYLTDFVASYRGSRTGGMATRHAREGRRRDAGPGPREVRRLPRGTPKHPRGLEALRLLFDLSHGAFFLDDAPKRWRVLYDAALRVRPQGFRRAAVALAERRDRVLRRCLGRPRCWARRVGPVLLVEAVGAWVPVPRALGGGRRPLRFDLNTVPPGVLRLVPGLTEQTVRRILVAREHRPFRSRADFRSRAAASADVLKRLRFL